MKKLLFGFAALTLIFSSCKKDDSGSGSGTRATLTTGMWKMTASSAVVEYPAPIGTQAVDVYSVIRSCEQDNLYRFNEDGTITSDEGATKCDASDPQQKSAGTWTLNGDQTKLTMTASGQNITADITTINSSTLVVKYVTNYNNMSATTTTTYAHQ